jgi:hypothetical protein
VVDPSQIRDPIDGRGLEFIYFIQGEHGGPIKIGYSQHPDQRLHDLQCGTPYPLVVRRVFPGDKAKELELHKRFAEGRYIGEWFEATPELVELAEARADEVTPVPAPYVQAPKRPRKTYEQRLEDRHAIVMALHGAH